MKSFQGLMVHRVDYHNVLKEVALSEEGVGMPVKLHLQSGVQSCDPEQGIITLRNGETHQGDVVIGADGIRVRDQVRLFVNYKNKSSQHSKIKYIEIS